MSKGALVDLVRCMGCRSCQVACKAWNDNPNEITLCLGCYDNPPAFSSDTWSLIRFTEVMDLDKLHWVFAKLQCMHCEHPGCVTACPVGALKKTDDGPVVYDDKKCIGCRTCVYTCPFGAATFDRSEGTVFMCNLCEGDPLCARWCPFGVLEYIRSDETSIRLKKDAAIKLLDSLSLSLEQVGYKEV